LGDDFGGECTSDSKLGDDFESGCSSNSKLGDDFEGECTSNSKLGDDFEGGCTRDSKLGDDFEGGCSSNSKLGDDFGGECTSDSKLGDDFEGGCSSNSKLGDDFGGECTSNSKLGDDFEGECRSDIANERGAMCGSKKLSYEKKGRAMYNTEIINNVNESGAMWKNVGGTMGEFHILNSINKSTIMGDRSEGRAFGDNEISESVRKDGENMILNEDEGSIQSDTLDGDINEIPNETLEQINDSATFLQSIDLNLLEGTDSDTIEYLSSENDYEDNIPLSFLIKKSQRAKQKRKQNEISSDLRYVQNENNLPKENCRSRKRQKK
jgi:hypothetical protein